MSTSFRVILDGVALSVPAGTTVLDAARKAGRPIAWVCDGQVSCLQCQVRVLTDPAALSPAPPQELFKIGRVTDTHPRRLACQARVLGPVTVETVFAPDDGGSAGSPRRLKLPKGLKPLGS
jgi:ferredoxin, 2Fe-2S